MATTLQIVTALQQAAANAYDGSHDEKFTGKDLAKEIGLKREEGCAIKDSRVIDGFNVRVLGNTVMLSYHTECTAKQSHNPQLVSDIDATDTYHLHEKLGTLVEGFYTGTNVSDFYLYAFEK